MPQTTKQANKASKVSSLVTDDGYQNVTPTNNKVREVGNCLSPFRFRLLQQNTRDWMAYKPQKFIFHSSGGWKSMIRVPAWLAEGPPPGHRLLLVSSH